MNNGAKLKCRHAGDGRRAAMQAESDRTSSGTNSMEPPSGAKILKNQLQSLLKQTEGMEEQTKTQLKHEEVYSWYSCT